jgi:hypothetical protein
MAVAPCVCLDGEARYDVFDELPLGQGEARSDVSVQTCRSCRRRWLHLLLEFEGFTGSGRWYRGLLAPDAAASAGDAHAVLAALPGYFAGGSHFNGRVHRRSGPLPLQLLGGGLSFSRSTPAPPLPRPEPALPPALQRIVRDRDDGDPRFPPRIAPGPRIAFTCRSVARDVTEVWVDDRRLTEIPGSAVHACPFCSPDGRTLGLHAVHLEPERSALLVVPGLRGGVEILYESGIADPPEPGSWSPSGRTIVFPRTKATAKPGDGQPVVLEVATGGFWPLADPGDLAGPPRFLDDRRLRVGDTLFEFGVPI